MATESPARLTLPASVLTEYVFPFVGVKTLKRCAGVCKEWRSAVDEDVVWKHQCALMWRNKKNVPKLVINKEGEEEPECLYPYALYWPQVKLSLKEIKQILASRGVHTEKFLEKSEFQKALELSQAPSIGRWSKMYSSKWKTSYVYSAVRAVSDKITRQELITTVWKMEFKFNGMTAESKFLGDGSYWSTLGNINREGNLTWMFVPNTDGNVFEFGAVRVGDYPQLVVCRSENWGYELHNDYVVLRQQSISKYA